VKNENYKMIKILKAVREASIAKPMPQFDKGGIMPDGGDEYSVNKHGTLNVKTGEYV